MNWWDIAPPFMYCVFHHISSHLQRQICFWKISAKTWASVRPPHPCWAKSPSFSENQFWWQPSYYCWQISFWSSFFTVYNLYHMSQAHMSLGLLCISIWAVSQYVSEKITGAQKLINRKGNANTNACDSLWTGHYLGE